MRFLRAGEEQDPELRRASRSLPGYYLCLACGSLPLSFLPALLPQRCLPRRGSASTLSGFPEPQDTAPTPLHRMGRKGFQRDWGDMRERTHGKPTLSQVSGSWQYIGCPTPGSEDAAWNGYFAGRWSPEKAGSSICATLWGGSTRSKVTWVRVPLVPLRVWHTKSFSAGGAQGRRRQGPDYTPKLCLRKPTHPNPTLPRVFTNKILTPGYTPNSAPYLEWVPTLNPLCQLTWGASPSFWNPQPRGQENTFPQ